MSWFVLIFPLLFRFPVTEVVEQVGAKVKAGPADKSAVSGSGAADDDVKGITQAMGSASVKDKKGRQ